MNTAEYLLGMVSIWMRENLTDVQGRGLPDEIRDFVDPDKNLFRPDTLPDFGTGIHVAWEEIPEVVEWCKSNQKIHAIKSLRDFVKNRDGKPPGLKETKDWIDHYFYKTP